MSDDLMQSTGVTHPLVLLQSMIAKDMDVGKMMDYAERWQANQDASAYSLAVVGFQSKMPAIEKTNPVFGKDKTAGPQYYFATFEDIMEVAQPLLTEYGISVSFDTKTDGSMMTTTCFLQVGSFIKSRSVTLGLPQIPNADDSKRAGAALSYGKRYSFMAALNIRVKGEDNESQDLSPGLTKAHTVGLNELISDCRDANPEFNSQLFWDWVFKAKGTTKTMADLLDSEFARVEDGLRRKLKKLAPASGDHGRYDPDKEVTK